MCQTLLAGFREAICVSLRLLLTLRRRFGVIDDCLCFSEPDQPRLSSRARLPRLCLLLPHCKEFSESQWIAFSFLRRRGTDRALGEFLQVRDIIFRWRVTDCDRR